MQRFRHAPANPQIHAGLRADKRNIIGAILHYGSRDIDVTAIVMVVGRQYGVNLTDSERIENKRRGAQVRL